MLGIGFALGIIVTTVLYGLSSGVRGSSDRTNAGRRFFLERTFLFAALLGISFLVLSLLIEGFLLKGVEGYSSVFLDWSTYASVAKEFFFAFVIAMFVIATVELSSKAEQKKFVEVATESAQKNVFNAVFKRSIQPEIFDEVEDSIYNARFVRSRHVRSITLNELNGDSSYILMNSTQDFRVRNVARTAEEYALNVYLPKPPVGHDDGNLIESVSVYSVIDGKRGERVYCIDNSREISLFVVDNQGAPEELHYVFPPQQVLPSNEIEIVVTLRLVKERYDNEIWTSLIPTLTAEVLVENNVDGLRVGAMSLHRGIMKPVGGEIGTRLRRWEIEKPLLPYQGYVVTWSAAGPDPVSPEPVE